MQFPGQTPFFYPQQPQTSGGSSAGLILLLLLTPVAVAGGVFLYTFQKIKQGLIAVDPNATMTINLVAATLFSLEKGVVSPAVNLAYVSNKNQVTIATSSTTTSSSKTGFWYLPLTIAHDK